MESTSSLSKLTNRNLVVFIILAIAVSITIVSFGMPLWETITGIVVSDMSAHNGTTANVTDEGHENYENETNTKKSPKIILAWVSFFGDRTLTMGSFGQKPFIQHDCPVNNCYLTNDRRYQHNASAIVFHVRNLEGGNLPVRNSASQIYAFLLFESPIHSGQSRALKNQFNLTMTYRLDSDIPMPYIPNIRLKDEKHNLRNEKYVLKHVLKNRHKNVVWTVSNCQTPSKREVYVKGLRQFIDVDIYGACGPLKCPKNEYFSCQEKFSDNYKFFLAFENSVCKDYVTEKYGKILQHELIPIVYGGANYSAIGPPGSFINILDYKSPKHLAEYLHFLSKNETAFLEYFQWKQSYTVENSNVNIIHGMCRLCAILNEGKYRRSYSDISKWWNQDTCDANIVNNIVKSAG